MMIKSNCVVLLIEMWSLQTIEITLLWFLCPLNFFCLGAVALIHDEEFDLFLQKRRWGENYTRLLGAANILQFRNDKLDYDNDKNTYNSKIVLKMLLNMMIYCEVWDFL